VELERLEVTEAYKTLEGKTAPKGDNTTQFEHMLEVSQKWAAQIKASNLRQMDAWLAGAPLYHMEDPGVPYYMHNTDQEAIRSNHATSNVSRTGQVS
jgi:hypothetical protein